MTGLVYDSGDHDGGARPRRSSMVGYDDLRAEQQRRRAAGETRPPRHRRLVLLRDVRAGPVPGAGLAQLHGRRLGVGHRAHHARPTRCRSSPAPTPHGQGHETSWSMIVADRLGVAPDDVEVLHSDTAISPLGLDTYGSRSLAVGGMAIYLAVDKVIDKARTIAAHLMEAAEEDLEFEGGTFSVRGSPDHSLPLAAVAFEAFTAHNLPDGVEPNLEAHVTYDPPNFSWPFGTHICVVEVDEETGARRGRASYVAVDDCGNQINPLIVEGQVHGGVVQGLAQALFEEAVYDDDGNLDHLDARRLPRARPRPTCPRSPPGRPSRRARPTRWASRASAKPGTIGAAPAVINAVVDALVAPRGHRHGHAGLTPDTCGTAIQAAAATAGGSPMIPAAFDYVRADSPDQAISLLTEHGDEAKLLAGGHSLLPLMKLRLASPSVLIDVGRLSDLSYVRDGGDHVAIGALTRHRDLETSALLQAAGADPGPRRRARSATRRCATAAPSAARWPTPIRRRTCLRSCSPSAARSWPGAPAASARSRRPTSTGASSSRRSKPDELLTEIRVPKVAGAGWSFQKFNRRAQDWAIVGVAAVRNNGSSGVALVNMGSTPIYAQARRRRHGRAGRPPTDAAEHAADDAEPQSDINASVEYRTHLAKVLVRRALEEAGG